MMTTDAINNYLVSIQTVTSPLLLTSTKEYNYKLLKSHTPFFKRNLRITSNTMWFGSLSITLNLSSSRISACACYSTPTPLLSLCSHAISSIFICAQESLLSWHSVWVQSIIDRSSILELKYIMNRALAYLFRNYLITHPVSSTIVVQMKPRNLCSWTFKVWITN